MKFLTLSLILSLFITSCSNLPFVTNSHSARLPASSVDEITYYLSIDKFKYYLNEYSVAQEGKIPDSIIAHLREMSIESIMKMDLDQDELKDAINYDKLIVEILEKEGLLKDVNKTQLKWGYNFFKNKLNEAFALSESKLDINLSIPSEDGNIHNGITIKPTDLSPEDMTLDSGHYISNRTTRAIFWEANENNRPIEFHLGDSREFLKELKAKNGEILFEVKPFAKNYNKIYIIQYPGEKTYRYAITNIGGKDRLDHLSHQISLSNFKGAKLKTNVVVKGDINQFHAAKIEEHEMQLRLLPKADRVIIGQKESIDGKFGLFWKIKALKNLYADDQVLFHKKLAAMPEKDREKFFVLLNGNNYENLFKDKKYIEDAYALLEADINNSPDRVPGKFKIYNYDNFTVEMCDYVFESEQGKTVRWRVVSNVWGDEVVPIAQALKNTGHTNVSYMGTAGAFAEKGYKVGDLVIPSGIRDQVGTLPMGTDNHMKIEGARYGGVVEHVGSPFEEDKAWLAKARAQSDFVEVETSYLRRIFNGPNDKLEFYLLISDILGSDTETLAHATSSKRKNAQNKLLAKLFERDAKKAPYPAVIAPANETERIKNLVFTLLEKKNVSYRYYAFSHLRNTKNLTAKDVTAFAEKNVAFTDAYILERLVKIGEFLTQLRKKNGDIDFDVAFDKSVVTGTWNPKVEKLNIIVKPKNSEGQKVLVKSLEQYKQFTDQMKSFATFDVSLSIVDPNKIWMKIPTKIDPDVMVKVYSHSGFKNVGLYKNVTYNGNVTLDYLPTNKTENPLEVFYQGAGNPAANPEGPCMEIMKKFMLII